MTNFVMNFEDAVPHEFCDRVIARLEQLLDEENVHTSYMEGSHTNNGYRYRKDYSHNFKLADPDINQEMHQFLNEYVHKYCEMHPSYGMTPCMSDAMKVQKTTAKGGFHQWHCEQGYGDMSQLRTLTWTLYLNNVPEGEGETEFLELGLKVQPKKGMLSFFPAAWTHTHRGNPVYTTTKYIATGWYYAMS